MPDRYADRSEHPADDPAEPSTTPPRPAPEQVRSGSLPESASAGVGQADLRVADESLAEVVSLADASFRLQGFARRASQFAMSVRLFLTDDAVRASLFEIPGFGHGAMEELSALVHARVAGYTPERASSAPAGQQDHVVVEQPSESGEEPAAASALSAAQSVRLGGSPGPSSNHERETTVAARLAAVTLADLIQASETSVRLGNMPSRAALFGRRTVADLLSGRLSDEELLAAPALGAKTLGELRALAEAYAVELWTGVDRIGTSEESEEHEDGRDHGAGGRGAAEQGARLDVPPELARLTLSDLALYDGFPVRIANRLSQEPQLAALTVGELAAEPASVGGWLAGLDGLGRRSVAELFDLVDDLIRQRLLETATGSGEEQGGRLNAPASALDALAALDARQRFILERRYGLDGQAPATLEEVAEGFSVTRERVRQIQKKALLALSKLPWRATFETLLQSSGAEMWDGFSGRRRFVPDSDVAALSRSLGPLAALSIDVVHGSVEAWLAAAAVRGPGGWLPPGASSADFESGARLLRGSLERMALPRPFDEIAADAGLSLADAEAALALAPGYSLRSGYVVEGVVGQRARRIVRLHSLARRHAVGNVIDVWRLAALEAADEHDDERSARMVQLQLAQNPHLFLHLFDQFWIVLPADREWSVAALSEATGQGVAASPFESGSILAWLFDTLQNHGPLRLLDLRERLASDLPEVALTSIAPMLLTHPCFARVAPGVYDVRRGDNYVSTSTPDSLLSAHQCRIYARARRSGAPVSYFSAWNRPVEQHLCEWARQNADGDLFRSLLAVAEPEEWSAPEQTRLEWTRLRQLQGRWLFSSAREQTLGAAPPEASHFCAALAHLVVYGSIGVIGAGRVSRAILGSESAADLLALLAVTGMVEPPTDWQRPHLAAIEIRSVLARMTRALYATGNLSWAASPLSDLLNQAHGRTDAVRWAASSEVGNLLSVLAGGVASEAAPANPTLAGVDDLFAAGDWEAQFASDDD